MPFQPTTTHVWNWFFVFFWQQYARKFAVKVVNSVVTTWGKWKLFVMITPLFLCRFQICFRQCVWNNIGQISLIYTTHLSSKLAKINLEWPWRNVPRSKISSLMDVPPWYYRWKRHYISKYSLQFQVINKKTRLSGHPVYWMKNISRNSYHSSLYEISKLHWYFFL